MQPKTAINPDNIRLEPAARGTDSIQAVSAANIPQSVLKESSNPTVNTRIKHTLTWKYGRKVEADLEAKKLPPAIVEESDGICYAGAPRQ